MKSMKSKKPLWRFARRSGVVTGAVLLGRALARAGQERGQRWWRPEWWRGRLQGLRYRFSGAVPDPDVDDRTLADRIRSSLGPLEKRLDVPHVHVFVEGHLAILHGEVGDESDAEGIEEAVLNVSGVYGLESYLHVGLVAGDTRPSEGGGAAVPSGAMRSLLDAARAGGAGAHAGEAVRATLATLADRLPDGERQHLLAHLPADVRALLVAPRRHRTERLARTARELVATVVAEGRGVASDRAPMIVEGILGRLRTLVPEEAADIAAVLPADLREFWLHSLPADPFLADPTTGRTR